MRTLLLEQRKNPQYSVVAARNAQKNNKAYNESKLQYVVRQLVNSTEPAVSSIVSKVDVDRYCESPIWKVTIKGKK